MQTQPPFDVVFGAEYAECIIAEMIPAKAIKVLKFILEYWMFYSQLYVEGNWLIFKHSFSVYLYEKFLILQLNKYLYKKKYSKNVCLRMLFIPLICIFFCSVLNVATAKYVRMTMSSEWLLYVVSACVFNKKFSKVFVSFVHLIRKFISTIYRHFIFLNQLLQSSGIAIYL